MKKHNSSKDPTSVGIQGFDASHFLLTSVKKKPRSLFHEYKYKTKVLSPFLKSGLHGSSA